jgi:N-acetylglucosaminyldiphosphoundecaprenol N-acetyl-beta-D-mannosaminyltransferase
VKHTVFGLEFSTLAQTQLRHEVIRSAELQRATSVIFANAHVVVEASREPALHELLRQVDIIVPDGMPVAWLLKSLGEKQTQRYSGPDFMVDTFKDTPQSRHFFLGSTEQTLEKIKNKFSGVAAGFYSPPFTRDEFSKEELQKQMTMIEESKADFIWVGLGAPKQEKYVAQMAAQARRGVWLAVGAAFDFYAETKPRAPRFLQAAGLEWAFRLASEPRRLAGRYLDTNPAFVKMALGEVLKAKYRRS